MPRKKNWGAAKDVSRTSPPRAVPAFITPMAAHVVDRLPEGREWLYELKFDGYRALILKNRTKIEVRSRKDKDLARMYPSVAAAGLKVQAEQAIIDGEIVALNQEGRPSFQALQHRSSHPQHTIVFYAFDLLHLNGHDLTSVPLQRRRSQLPAVVEGSGILLSKELPGTVSDIIQSVQQFGLEGIVAKRKDSLYMPGERSQDWLKLKLEHQQEFVIGGYRPDGSSVDALLVGYYENDELRFAGKVRGGFVPNVRRDVFEKLKGLRTKECPFADLPSPSGGSHWGGGITVEEMREMHWVRPQVLAQIRFVEWTAEGRLRHAKFLGLRTDKKPIDVQRES